MAAYKVNAYGSIRYSDAVLAKLAGLSATECSGVLGLASADSWTDILKKETLDKGIRITSDQENVEIEVNIIVKYGVAISAVAKNIIDNVQYAVQKYTGLKVKRVNVVVRSIRL